MVTAVDLKKGDLFCFRGVRPLIGNGHATHVMRFLVEIDNIEIAENGYVSNRDGKPMSNQDIVAIIEVGDHVGMVTNNNVYHIHADKRYVLYEVLINNIVGYVWNTWIEKL